MTAERWRRRTLPSLRTAPGLSSQNDLATESEPIDGKRPRAFSKALRSLSSSSMESMSASPTRSSTTTRRLQKTQSGSGSGSMIGRIHRRVSRDSPISTSPPELLGAPGMSEDIPYTSMEMIRHGPLKADISLLKARCEYLVLTDQCLVKFGSAEAARAVFPQSSQCEPPIQCTGSSHGSSSKVMADARLEVSLRSIVAAFNEEGSSPRFGIEIWWFSQWPRLAYSKTHLFFAHPKERDDWLADIQRSCRARLRQSSATSLIPDNLKTRINHIVDTTEPMQGGPHSMTFPVAKRTIPIPQKVNPGEETHHLIDSSSFYIVIGPCMCYFLEVLKADYTTSPGDLRVKVQSFGTVTLNRFKASVASQEQRFVMSFR